MSENSLTEAGVAWDAEEYAPAAPVLAEDPAEGLPAEPGAGTDAPIEDPERPEPVPLDEDDYAHEVP
ncbi:hypothetical protein [Kineococcus glutinatus]|uniref:Uncharacterized protein n=1 Tax=Kineococcus glutinatus TaxID=1070872 RepID=A0ABP9HUU5_9ACTN